MNLTTPKWLVWFDRRNLFVITLVLAGVIYSQFQFLKQPTRGDWSMYDYIAQMITRGGVPYRDVVDIKTPLSMDIGSAAIKIAEQFGVRDILAIRICYVFLAMLTAGFTFLVAHDYFESRRTLFTYGRDTYLNNVESGGFDGWFSRLKAERPKVIGLSRMRGVEHGAEIEQWVHDSYERRDGSVFSYYLRKDRWQAGKDV